jgi:hypothetical protein
MEAFVNQLLSLNCRLDDGITNLYPQAKVYNRDGTLVTTCNLSHISDGNYKDYSWTPPSSGYFTVNYTIYSNVGRTIEDTDYNKCIEEIFVINSIAQSSQIVGISSQLHGLSMGATDLSPILEELDFISSQLWWNSGMTFSESSQIRGISSQVAGTGIGLTPTQIWSYSSRTLTDGINDSILYISSQMNQMTQQLTAISSNVESYGGGGGSPPKTYIYTSKQGPWKFREKEDIIANVKSILSAIETVEKKTEQYHADEIKNLLKVESNILESIDKALNNLDRLKMELKMELNNLDDKDVKLMENINKSITNLNVYRSEVESKYKDLEAYLEDILTMVGDVVSIDKLEELETYEK